MIAALQAERMIKRLNDLAPSGFAIALRATFASPRYIVQTYDDAWRDHYSSAALFLVDPIVRWSVSNEGIADHADLVALDRSRVFATARSHGLKHWAVVSTTMGGGRSFAGFSRPDQPFLRSEKECILELVTDLHRLSLTTVHDPQLHEYMRALSLRQTRSRTDHSRSEEILNT